MKVFVLACSLLLASSQGQAGDPGEFYKQYLAAFAKADTLAQVLQFYSKELSDLYAKAPKEGQAAYFKMHAAKQKLNNIRITKQNVTGDKAVLDVTATTGDGSAATGQATLVKEGGQWKVSDEAWALPPPKG